MVHWDVTNRYITSGDVTRIELIRKGVAMLTEIDTRDLPIADSFAGTWYANPARKSSVKFYVNGKIGNKTILLHRLLCGNPVDDVHHKDNDGLNNRRSSNLVPLTHLENARERFPGRDWAKLDANRQLASEYRQERAIAREIARKYGLSRQAIWRIRNGARADGDAAREYLSRVNDAFVRTLAQMQADRPRDGKWGIGKSANLCAL